MKLVKESNDLEARFEVGRLYTKYGTIEEGIRWLKTVLAVDPDHEPTHALLADYCAEAGDNEQERQHRQHVHE